MADDAYSFPSHDALSIFDDYVKDNNNDDCLRDPFSLVSSPSNLNISNTTQPNPSPSVARPNLLLDGPAILSNMSPSDETAGPSSSQVHCKN